MTRPTSPYQMQPPVLSARVDTTMDVMIVRNTARRAGGLLGFTPAHLAQLASAAATLAELTLMTNSPHTIHFNGVSNNDNSGIQISTSASWLTGVASGNVMIALRSKMGELVDEILVEGANPPVIMMIVWRGGEDASDDSEEYTP
ncbi:MAG: hypothetical protein KC496_17225 [Anaerolineae bacterium]|nr:hypothetical protein [Anaerolineae bacterium]